MAPDDLPVTATAIAAGVRAGEFSAVEVAEATVRRIESVEPTIQAFLHLMPERALEAARLVDAARARGEALGAMPGVPVALKDNMCLAGVPCTCASKILEGYVP